MGIIQDNLNPSAIVLRLDHKWITDPVDLSSDIIYSTSFTDDSNVTKWELTLWPNGECDENQGKVDFTN